jgi:hypothetical protein
MVNVIAKVNFKKSSILPKEKSRKYKKVMSKKMCFSHMKFKFKFKLNPN